MNDYLIYIIMIRIKTAYYYYSYYSLSHNYSILHKTSIIILYIFIQPIIIYHQFAFNSKPLLYNP